MSGLCPFCAATTGSAPGAVATCPRCGRDASAVAPALPVTTTLTLDEPTTELPLVAPARRRRIVWPRVLVLAAITVVASAGAWAALHDVATRTAPAPDTDLAADAAPSLASALSGGPRIGDLRSLVAYVPEEAPPKPSPQAPAPARRPLIDRDNGFVVVTGPREPWFQWTPRGIRPTRNCPPGVCR